MDNTNSDPNNPLNASSDLGQPAGSPPVNPPTSPWETPPQTNISQSTPIPGMDQTNITPPTPMTDPLGPPAQAPEQPSQSPWPSSASTLGFEAPSPQPPGFPDPALQNPAPTNPFLQSQAQGIGIPQEASSMPQASSVTDTSNFPQPPSIPQTQDPLGNTFPPANTPEPTGPDPMQMPHEESLPANPSDLTPPSVPAGQGALDLSALQSAPLPDMGPQENAPTDLSHLIAGDESHHQPGDVYAPPVAQDQNPNSNSIPSQTPSEGSVPPPGKHLNLTKVLLIAGIPIILIVGALSAYLILGIGKPSSEANNPTSLPLEQSKEQAPLTNPPSQITPASSPNVSAPETPINPLMDGSESSQSGTALPTSSSPAGSLSPAMKAAQKASSPSPSSSASQTLP